MSVSKESRNLAKSKPELVEELLIEAELVVREAPPAVRGDMAQVGSQIAFLSHFCQLFKHPKHPLWTEFLPKVGAPVGPQEGSIYSMFASLGTRYSPTPPP